VALSGQGIPDSILTSCAYNRPSLYNTYENCAATIVIDMVSHTVIVLRSARIQNVDTMPATVLGRLRQGSMRRRWQCLRMAYLLIVIRQPQNHVPQCIVRDSSYAIS
jgi:prophage DNA circulation protein